MRHLVFGLVLLVWAIPCAGRVITVDDDGPADFNNIQAAINDANDGDIVEVDIGTYTGDGNRDIDFLGKAITVRSTDPNDWYVVGATVIDCQWGGRGFYFHNNEDTNSTIAGLTIKGGKIVGLPGRGGGIYCSGSSSPTIENCVIEYNKAIGSSTSVLLEGWGGYGGVYIAGQAWRVLRIALYVTTRHGVVPPAQACTVAAVAVGAYTRVQRVR
jgi:hypothetical protein